jgi:hypothetical protein
MSNTNTTKTFATQVTYSAIPGTWYLIESASVTSPRTGVTLNLSRKSLESCPAVAYKIRAACGRRGQGVAQFTLADFSDVLNAVEDARDSYKASMDHDCTAGLEETDGECEGCDRNILACRCR